MPRIDEALLGGKAWDTSARGSLDLRHGGQFGWMPNLAELHNNQGYVPRNLTVLAVEPPKFFQFMPNPEVWFGAFKALVEKHPIKVDGFKQGLKVATTEHDVGGAGEKQQEYTNVTRERTEPVFTFVEKETRPIQRFLDVWIRFGLMDPDAKFALIGTLTDQKLPDDWLFDWYAGTILAYETDITNRFVDKAWLTTNFFPHENGPVNGTRELTANREILTLDIPFSGTSASGHSIVMMAQSIHDKITKTNANPQNKPAFVQDIAPVLADIKRGYKWSVESVGEAATNPLGNYIPSTGQTSGGPTTPGV